MKAPEKIYLCTDENGIHYYTEGTPFEREHVEYISTDTFIEKACNAYCKVCKIPNCRSNECKWLSDFKKHLETI